MNIFPLEYQKYGESQESWVARIAKSHCDQHVNKMVSEARQMLNTNRNLLGLPSATASMAYKNHPCTVWARENESNALWLYDLAVALNASGMERSGRKSPHKDLLTIEAHDLWDSSDNATDELTTFAMAMPDSLKKRYSDDPVAGYREYYCTNKSWFARKDPKNEGKYIAYPSTWKTGEPEWFQRVSLKRTVLGGNLVGWQGSKKIVLTKDILSNYEDFV